MQKAKKEDQKKIKKWKWKILLSFGFIYFFYYFGRENIGIILPLIKEEFCFNSFQLGIVTNGFFITYAFGQLIWGRLSDRIGGGKLLCGIGGLLSMVLNWICSFSSSIIAIGFFWAINGLVQSMGWSPGNKLISNWWDNKERGYALSVVLSFSGIAILLLWLFGSYIGTHWGWKGLFRFPTVLLGIMSIIFLFLVKDNPQQAGLLIQKKENLKGKNKENYYDKRIIKFYLDMFKIIEFDLACLVISISNFTRYFFTLWMPLYYFEKGGFAFEKVIIICSMLPAGMTIGSLAVGEMSLKIFKGKKYLIIIVFLLTSMLSTFILSFISVNSIIWNMIFLFLVGFSIYGLQGPIFALSMDIVRENQIATVVGTMDSVSYVIGSLQGIITGTILTLSGENWRLIFVVIALIQLIGLIIYYKFWQRMQF